MATATLKPGTPTGTSIESSALQYVCDLVRRHSAIMLDPSKAYLVDSRLTPLARQLEFASIEALVAAMQSKPYGELHRQVVDAMTTNETSFFRDIHPFDVLRQTVLPELIARRGALKSLRIWSAACSTGQEPYTIAIMLRENFPQLANWNIRIIATDLSQQVLGRAKEGLFSQQEVNRGLPVTMLVKHFKREGMQWRVNPEVRALIQFSELNLIANWPTMPALDIVFLRNVLIYFSPETKSAILEKVRRSLSPDGYLFLGGAETTLNLHDGFERVRCEKTAYYSVRPVKP
jgi:chemotaxis protein methyltransferase CheR